ncbi:MAG: LUD domain-containing protein [Acidocella sp.]|nr:LUD domain-containing protein [Acidocella sp.]
MNNARTEILKAIGKGPGDRAAIAAQAQRLRADACRPDRVNGPADAVFIERLRSPGIAATAERVATMRDFPDAVRRYLAVHQLGPSLALQPHPQLRALDWSGIETRGPIGTDEPVAVGLALGGVAETGSLVFHSSAVSPTLFCFLPLHHIVAVRASQIWPWLEDYADAIAGCVQPRNVNLITGASGTTDIEGTLVRGAHGPGWLHVVLISDAQ